MAKNPRYQNRDDENCETVLLYQLSYSPEVFTQVELMGLEPTTCSSDSIRHRVKSDGDENL